MNRFRLQKVTLSLVLFYSVSPSRCRSSTAAPFNVCMMLSPVLSPFFMANIAGGEIITANEEESLSVPDDADDKDKASWSVEQEDGEEEKDEYLKKISELDKSLHQLQRKIEEDLNRVVEDATEMVSINLGKSQSEPTAEEQEAADDVIVENGDVVDQKTERERNSQNSTITDSSSILSKPIVASSTDPKMMYDLSLVKADVEALLRLFSEIENEVHLALDKMEKTEEEAREKAGQIEVARIIEKLQSGKLGVHVDYITGELKKSKEEAQTDDFYPDKKKIGNIEAATPKVAPASTTTGVHSRAAKYQDQAPNREQQDIETSLDALIAATVRSTSSHGKKNSIASDVHRAEFIKMLQSRVHSEIEHLREEGDPAVMQMDIQLLLDVVTLAITAALFGLFAVFLSLPPTAGFLVGGMLIGPSSWNLIEEVKQVQTLAQFGSIFLLFEQGLLYSQTYSGVGRSNANHRLVRNARHPTTAMSEEHNPNVVGAILLIILIFTAMAIFFFTGLVSSPIEAFVIAASVSLCGSTVVSENLQAARIAHTSWGFSVMMMVAIQDLFTVPLLAIPDMIQFLFGAEGASSYKSIFFRFVGIIAFLAGSMTFARHIINAVFKAQSRSRTEGDLVTLGIVAYALMMATISEELQLSLEAGAVFAGIALMKSVHVPKILKSIRPITSVFGGMYLTSLGMIISPTFVRDQVFPILLTVIFIALFKLTMVSTILIQFFNYNITSSLAVGSGMAQISDTSLVIMAKAQRMGLVPRQIYLMFIPSTCILLSLAPFSAAHLRHLKMKEITGDDGDIPFFYLCFLRCVTNICQNRRPPSRPDLGGKKLNDTELCDNTKSEI